MQIESRRADGSTLERNGVPGFLGAESEASGEYYCADCGYGVTIRRILPVCPMCRGRSWEDAATSPFARSRV
jgi:rubrerythrin